MFIMYGYSHNFETILRSLTSRAICFDIGKVDSSLALFNHLYEKQRITMCNRYNFRMNFTDGDVAEQLCDLLYVTEVHMMYGDADCKYVFSESMLKLAKLFLDNPDTETLYAKDYIADIRLLVNDALDYFKCKRAIDVYSELLHYAECNLVLSPSNKCRYGPSLLANDIVLPMLSPSTDGRVYVTLSVTDLLGKVLHQLFLNDVSYKSVLSPIGFEFWGLPCDQRLMYAVLNTMLEHPTLRFEGTNGYIFNERIFPDRDTKSKYERQVSLSFNGEESALQVIVPKLAWCFMYSLAETLLTLFIHNKDSKSYIKLIGNDFIVLAVDVNSTSIADIEDVAKGRVFDIKVTV